MQDTKYKREYLNNAQNWLTITGEENDESDKHLEENSLDAGIQDRSTSISIVLKFD